MLQEMGFLWAAAAVVWLGILWYIAALLRRQSRLGKEIAAVNSMLQELAAATQAASTQESD